MTGLQSCGSMKRGIAVVVEDLAVFFMLFGPPTTPAAVSLRVMKDVGALPLSASLYTCPGCPTSWYLKVANSYLGPTTIV